MTAPLIIMGVQGCGKSTIGKMLAQERGQPFFDGDDLHSSSNTAKMSAGIPLTDEDREPWLASIAVLIAAQYERGNAAVVACSALKRSYRDILRSTVPCTKFIHLSGPFDVLFERIGGRHHEYMPPILLTSQFETLQELQEDEAGTVVSVELTPQEIVDQAQAYLAAK